jgi:trehalose 6-phosphate synthase
VLGPDSGGRRLIVAANRGPVSFRTLETGETVATRGLGGLVTVLTEVLRQHEGTWVAAAIGPEEAALAAADHAAEVELDGEIYRLRYVAVDAAAYHGYYNIVANPLLWFIQHYLWDLGRHPDIRQNEYDAWERGYVPVNRAFAAAIVDELGRDQGRGRAAAGGTQSGTTPSTVMLHDYHLYLVAPLVRAAVPQVFLHQFVHIPWPQSDAWRVLPEPIATAVVQGLLGNDVVAFHTDRYVHNFLRCCEDMLELRVDVGRRVVEHGGREVWVRAYPVSIDPASLRAAAASPEVQAAEIRLLAKRRDHLLLRVDRLDPSKNIIRGFLAFGRLLELHPELRERITFLALLQPSREDVEEYVTYRAHVVRAVEQINTAHGTTDWMPIDLRIQDDFAASLAAYGHYDVLYVNAISDGMNLVAKEGPVLNRRAGVLVLSTHAGAYEELGAFALGVNPFDVEQQARMLYEGLTMAERERRIRAECLRDVVESNSVRKWVDTQLGDIAGKLAAERDEEGRER